MFRQVIAHRWAEGVSEPHRAAFHEAVTGLAAIPEVVALGAGPDLRLFEGNHDYVTVIDFPDRDSAARYVAHPLHQAFIAAQRARMRDRVVVQHEWGAGAPVGVHHLKLPVADPETSRHWYIDTLGFVADLEFAESGALAWVSLRHPTAGLRLALRRDPERARALAGFDSLCLAVSTDTDLETLTAGLDARGVPHSGAQHAREGRVVELHDPDGIAIRLYSLQRTNTHPGSG